MNKKFKIFIDFDGTITTTDVGESMFLEFGNKEEVGRIIEGLLTDRISSKDCWLALCKSVSPVNKDELDNFIGEITIEPSFKDFIEFCSNNNIDYFILSDGFDYYIKRILEKENLENIKFYSNVLEISNNKLIPTFPYLDMDSPESANCKRNHIINNSSDEEYTVFIGDGNSDRYAAQFCDFIFAKSDLLKYCERERISYYPYENFNDVQQIMMKLLSKKRLKKRHQAELKRRDVYMAE
jgi:2,3-diketo-5-methylthio-1-phosphopentane phosphatase